MVDALIKLHFMYNYVSCDVSCSRDVSVQKGFLMTFVRLLKAQQRLNGNESVEGNVVCRRFRFDTISQKVNSSSWEQSARRTLICRQDNSR